MLLKLFKQASVIALFMATALACNRRPDVERDTRGDGARPAAAKLQPYPPGRWRLADTTDLTRVVLWVSHVLIRHRDVDSSGPAFAVADWHSQARGAERSRPEALALARQLRERAAGQGEPFAALASAYSEDIATQPLGGSLGGIRAMQLSLWPEVLDALAALRPGEVSQVVETQYGFHFFQLRSPPPQRTVSGTHIVVAHSDAGWIKLVGRGEAPSRSRADAFARANELYERAKKEPSTFSELVAEYSEHGDAVRSGDMGAWSTLEPSPIPRELEVLAKLAVGEVAPPLDSPVGFQIIQRTANHERETLALESIQLPFVAHDPKAKAAARAQATELLQRLLKEPSRFHELQKEHCCEYVEEWQDGRGLPSLTTALLRVRVGEIASEPVESLGKWVIAKRVAPSAPAPAITHELPSPKAPDIAAFFRSHDEAVVRAELQKVGDQALTKLALPEPTAARLRRLHAEDSRFKQPDTFETRTDAFNSLLSNVQRVLDSATYATYLELLNAHFERVLLSGGVESVGTLALEH